MTVLHSGSTGKYADNWSKAFSGKKKAQAGAKSTAKKKTSKKKAAKKKGS